MNDQRAEPEFAEFFRSSWSPCVRAVVAVTGRRELAEDQVAEAFTRAFMSWRKVSRHPAPRAWVVRTALNTGASWWRRRRHEFPLDDHDGVAAADPVGMDAAVLGALRRLPDRQREVIVLRGLSRFGHRDNSSTPRYRARNRPSAFVAGGCGTAPRP